MGSRPRSWLRIPSGDGGRSPRWSGSATSGAAAIGAGPLVKMARKVLQRDSDAPAVVAATADDTVLMQEVGAAATARSVISQTSAPADGVIPGRPGLPELHHRPSHPHLGHSFADPESDPDVAQGSCWKKRSNKARRSGS